MLLTVSFGWLHLHTAITTAASINRMSSFSQSSFVITLPRLLPREWGNAPAQRYFNRHPPHVSNKTSVSVNLQVYLPRVTSWSNLNVQLPPLIFAFSVSSRSLCPRCHFCALNKREETGTPIALSENHMRTQVRRSLATCVSGPCTPACGISERMRKKPVVLTGGSIPSSRFFSGGGGEFVILLSFMLMTWQLLGHHSYQISGAFDILEPCPWCCAPGSDRG